MKIIFLIFLLCCLFITKIYAQDIIITIKAPEGKRAVSPYIYGCNNSFDKSTQFYKDAGLRMSRMNQGNNATKYNWRKKISSHPDWYNNVYGNDWDRTSKNISANHPTMQVMWAFQLLGRVASNTSNNFNDWGFNQSQWWQGVYQNLAGGGVPNTENPSGDALVEGDVNLYTEEWPADSTVEILNHWFGSDGIGLNKNQFHYWNMDNEPDIWNGTHDDVMPTLISASEFMDRFIEVAKKARALYPEIKICGPVTTSEWQWYKWGNESIRIDGKYYCWFEYFIKRCADEEKASGIRVLDVFDIHHYPYAPTDNDALQNHRIFYDKDYNYPGANGLYTINGGWDTSSKKEYIFQRINDWLAKHFGENHGITLGLSEWSPGPDEPNLASVIYATHLGTFANNGVEYFTPWTWKIGMWETLHLFSRYAKSYSVSSTSSLENTVSAYTTVNETADSMTVIIVNRDINSARNVTVNLSVTSARDGDYPTLQLAALPSRETFISHDDNALIESEVAVKLNSFNITVPALSTTAVLLNSLIITGIPTNKNLSDEINIFPNEFRLEQNYPNPFNPSTFIDYQLPKSDFVTLKVFDVVGHEVETLVSERQNAGNHSVQFNASNLPSGVYFYQIETGTYHDTRKLLLLK